MRLDYLLKKLEAIAELYFDGHYTIMSFTTNYRVCFGASWNQFHSDDDPLITYNKMQEVPSGATLEQAIIACIKDFEDKTGNKFLQ